MGACQHFALNYPAIKLRAKKQKSTKGTEVSQTLKQQSNTIAILIRTKLILLVNLSFLARTRVQGLVDQNYTLQPTSVGSRLGSRLDSSFDSIVVAKR